MVTCGVYFLIADFFSSQYFASSHPFLFQIVNRKKILRCISHVPK